MLTHIEFDTSREFSIAELQYIQDWTVRSDYRSLGKLIVGRSTLSEDQFYGLSSGELFGVVLPALGRMAATVHARTQKILAAAARRMPEIPS